MAVHEMIWVFRKLLILALYVVEPVMSCGRDPNIPLKRGRSGSYLDNHMRLDGRMSFHDVTAAVRSALSRTQTDCCIGQYTWIQELNLHIVWVPAACASR